MALKTQDRAVPAQYAEYLSQEHLGSHCKLSKWQQDLGQAAPARSPSLPGLQQHPSCTTAALAARPSPEVSRGAAHS